MIMDNLDLYTVSLFQIPTTNSNVSTNNSQSHGEVEALNNAKPIKEFPNMISARILKGRIVELGHSKLVGPSVKFKTILNYDKFIEKDSSLGVALIHQEGYIAKLD